MAQLVITVCTLAVLTLMSLHANRRFAGDARLPMQWSLSGSVNWSAPRRLALAFTPVLAGAMMAGTTVASLIVPTRPGQEAHVVPVIAAMALIFMAVHALHLKLIEKNLN